MKINLPLNVISDCLKTSEVFREYVSRRIFSPSIDKAEIEDVFVALMKGNQKIAAIKALREYSRDDQDRLAAIKLYYPNYFGAYKINGCQILGLAASKKIVELYA